MPDSPTTRLGMYKSASDGSEDVSYTQDIGQNLDLLDAAVGYQAVTSSTRPSSPYSGKAIMETDTSYRTYFSNGTSPASASWVQIPNSSATYSGLLAQERASAATTATQIKVTGDSQQRLTIGADGKLTWGPGNAAGDTVLYREAASVLTTDDIFRVYRSAAGENAISLRVTGDANSRLYVNASGEMNWGPGGASSTDVTLARSSSGTLTLTGALTTSGNATVNGVLAAKNRVVGTVTITPSAANTPTSQAVTFPAALTGSTFYGVASASTTVPGSQVTGVAITSESSTGCTVWVTRTNTTATVIRYIVEGF